MGRYPGRVAGIGSLNESPLHAAVKRHVAPPGSRFEVEVGGYVVDVVANGLLLEVQTGNFGAMRAKLGALLPEHRLRVVLPIAGRRWIVKRHDDGRIDRRRSPKRGSPRHLFEELVALPTLLAHPHFELEVILIEEQEFRRHRPGRAWRRRGWVIEHRELVSVLERRLFREPSDLLPLLPDGLPETFTTADIAASAALPRRWAGQAAYCLAALGLVERVGKRGNAYVYRFTNEGAPDSDGAPGLYGAPGDVLPPEGAPTPASSSAARTSTSDGSTTVPLRK